MARSGGAAWADANTPPEDLARPDLAPANDQGHGDDGGAAPGGQRGDAGCVDGGRHHGGEPGLATNLVSDCFGFPEASFSPDNIVPLLDGQPVTRLHAGDRAVDFALRDLEGATHRLAEILDDKPVLLMQGSSSCIFFRAALPALRRLLASPWRDGPATWGEMVHVVVVFNVEAHPIAPDVSPYSGTLWQLPYSVVLQPLDYDARRAAADLVRGEIPAPALLLVDDLRPAPNNPVFCTYGACANCAFLIRPDGVIDTAQVWFDVPSMMRAVEQLIRE